MKAGPVEQGTHREQEDSHLEWPECAHVKHGYLRYIYCALKYAPGALLASKQ